MFRVTSAPIEPLNLDDQGAGGFVTFEGKVRNRNDGRPVERLEYEAYAPLAEQEGQKILDEAIAGFGLSQAEAIHRVGLLEIGETAVWVGVAAPHREQAFRACAFIVDELKIRVPIWKKEHYREGDSEWIGVPTAPPAEYYRRQMRLAEIGEAGQDKLKNAKVLVVGAGGLGCAALPYLAGAGVGHIGIADGDTVEISNLHRQVLFGFGDQGLPKNETAAKALRRLNPHIEIQTHGRITATNAEEIVQAYDIVLDGTDNFATKFLLNDVCVRLKTPLVQASLHRFEGQLMVVADQGCMRCLWPEAPHDGCVGTCAEEGILGAVAGVFGALQATEVLKIILGLDGILTDALLTMDLRTLDSHRLQRRRRPECPTCGTGQAETSIDIDKDQAQALGLTAIDIREPEEWNVIPGFEDCLRLPLSAGLAATTSPVLLICEHGICSSQAARLLRSQGIEAYSLVGGARAMRL